MSTPVPMSAPVQRIAELFERNLSIRHVYAEPVRNGDVTVIPVAKASLCGRTERRPSAWSQLTERDGITGLSESRSRDTPCTAMRSSTASDRP